jgi:soluble lytic murein transglycosylase
MFERVFSTAVPPFLNSQISGWSHVVSPRMFRVVSRLFILLFITMALGLGYVVYRSPDPLYTVAEWSSFGRFHRYDNYVRDVAAKYGVDPLLVKAVVWRESEFEPTKVGTSGERGLMQVSEAAARDWVRANKVETFAPTDLFDPRTNLEIGTWYLKKALTRYAGKDDPAAFALAEYNAGKTRVDRWVTKTNLGRSATADDLKSSIDFPKTRRYVDTILKRRDFYRERGRCELGQPVRP